MAVQTILAFNLNAPALDALGKICADLGLRMKAVPKEGFLMPLGGMIGMPVRSVSSPSAENFDEPMLVMCGLNEAKLNGFLQALRRSSVPAIPLKAVLTPTNAAWNALTLHEELRREHEQMLRMRKDQ